MKFACITLPVVVGLAALPLRAASLQMSATLDVFDDGGLGSKRYIEFVDDRGYLREGIPISYYHTIVNTSATAQGIDSTPSSGSLRDGPATAGQCYSARLTAETYHFDPYVQHASSAGPTCWYGPPRAPTGPEQPVDDGSGCTSSCSSPIVISVHGDRYQLSGIEDPVLFDIDANGTLDTLGWTARGAPLSFLGLDRNNNGKIDDGSELFGNHTPLAGGTIAANGFDALAPYDMNHDGIIDARDPVWQLLLLWTDLNHDGVSQAEELMAIGGSDVSRIDIGYHWTGRRDSSGNMFRYESNVWLARDGKHPTPRPVYDIFFITTP